MHSLKLTFRIEAVVECCLSSDCRGLLSGVPVTFPGNNPSLMT